MYSGYVFRLCILAIRLSIQALHGGYLFRLSTQDIRLSIQAIHAGHLFRLSIQDIQGIYSGHLFSVSAKPVLDIALAACKVMDEIGTRNLIKYRERRKQMIQHLSKIRRNGAQERFEMVLGSRS